MLEKRQMVKVNCNTINLVDRFKGVHINTIVHPIHFLFPTGNPPTLFTQLTYNTWCLSVTLCTIPMIGWNKSPPLLGRRVPVASLVRERGQDLDPWSSASLKDVPDQGRDTPSPPARPLTSHLSLEMSDLFCSPKFLVKSFSENWS